MVDGTLSLRLSFLAAPFFMLDAIPTVGFSDPILSYFSALRFLFDGPSRLKYGYEKTRRGLFKTATFRRWMVLASGPEHIEDVRKAPDDVLSIIASTIEFLQAEYTLDLLDMDTGYHTDVIRVKLTRNIATTFKDVRDELIRTLDASIPVYDDGVKHEAHAERRLGQSSRLRNDATRGRNEEYLTLNLNYAVNVLKFATIIGIFPKPLKPVCYLTFHRKSDKKWNLLDLWSRNVSRECMSLGNDWDDKPVRRSTLLHVGVPKEWRGPSKALRGECSQVNCAAIHTTSTTLTNVLYRLLSNPEYVEPLRQDVETAVAEEGWTKAGLDKMHKIDSFLRETQRMDCLESLTMLRLALRPFTFSNGVTVPAGTLIAAPTGAIHRDGEIYPNPEEFDGFRFTKPLEHDGNAMTGRQALSMSPENLTFGYGRHSCPGRFFGVSEVKALLAHIVVTYDIKFEEGKQAPRSFSIGSMRVPGKANAMFRKRQW
ncbi:cytochrome P450 [Lactarius indigo]|nr:cytochrome P450 [Lactarius indigo]